ncbi:MAG: thioredoxin family protein, partial [Marinifilaceae bacterium]|nr:thioredoxin family protein [Marinifilaceae bacterium]
MKKLVLVTMGMLCSIILFGQTNFQKLTINEAAAKAKAEGKMIFVDLYTSWCGPCKMMADKIFPDQELGKYMNERFVCVKYDAEKDAEGKVLAEKYAVTAYPTFLLLNADQALENQIVGGVSKPEEFSPVVEEALKFSLAALSRQYDEGNRDVVFLSHYLEELKKAHMDELAEKVCASFLSSASDAEKTSFGSWFIFDSEAMTPWGSDAFNYILNHFEQFANTVGE